MLLRLTKSSINTYFRSVTVSQLVSFSAFQTSILMSQFAQTESIKKKDSQIILDLQCWNKSYAAVPRLHAAGIESSNAARFKLISRISRGLQHNVMLLGRRSDLWRRPFSRCHQRAEHLQKKRQRQMEREGNTQSGFHKLVPCPKIKRIKSWIWTFSWQFSSKFLLL